MKLTLQVLRLVGFISSFALQRSVESYLHCQHHLQPKGNRPEKAHVGKEAEAPAP